jgi:predicted short-subunit dehydrogenase-like oxidoreductase (DUF2520 family)
VPGVAVVGLGNWGISLAHALQSAGAPLLEAVESSPSQRRGGPVPRAAHRLPRTSFELARFDAAIVWLCVPDSSIAEVTSRMVSCLVQRSGGHASRMKGQIVVHSSGALNASVLQAAARAGASVGSVHPVMSFPGRTPVPLSGVPFGVEAEAAARRKLNAVVRKIGGEPFGIAGSGKALYHAAGMFASPLLVSLIAAAEECATLAGLSPRQAQSILGPIAQATVKNVFRRGAARSFSGPIARGDLTTICLHLNALKQHQTLAAAYRSLVLYALDALPRRNAEEIRQAVKKFS